MIYQFHEIAVHAGDHLSEGESNDGDWNGRHDGAD